MNESSRNIVISLILQDFFIESIGTFCKKELLWGDKEMVWVTHVYFQLVSF